MDTNDLIRYYGLLCISSVYIAPNMTAGWRWVLGYAYFVLAALTIFIK